jgi:transposase
MTERARYWRRWLVRWNRSGLTQTEFCRRHGLKLANFAWWKRRLTLRIGAGTSRSEARSASAAKFVEVALPAERASGYEVVLSGGRVVRVPDEFDAESVSRLISAVESAGGQVAEESAC